jgi:hypothetical protein
MPRASSRGVPGHGQTVSCSTVDAHESDHVLRVSCVQPEHGKESLPESNGIHVPFWHSCSSHSTSKKFEALMKL